MKVTEMKRAGQLTRQDFSEALWGREEEFSSGLMALIDSMDFSHQVMEGAERELMILAAVRALLEERLPVSGPERHQAWVRGWQEVLENFRQSGQGAAALTPQYFRPFQIVRWQGLYLRPLVQDLELNIYKVFRRHVFDRFLLNPEIKHVFEFGCGTAHNLVALAAVAPEKQLFGLDWANPSQALITEINRELGLNIKGQTFDFQHPAYDLEAPSGSAFLTMNALEQLGGNHAAFIEFCLDKRPALCVHTEPIEELYDQRDLMDYLAWRYHHKRGYLSGYLSRVRELEELGKAEIIEASRFKFGSLFHEGHSVLVWRPL